MCGLAGGISIDLSKTEREVIRHLIGNSFYRGSHSTGMLSWARKVLSPNATAKEKANYNPLHYYKSLNHPLDFVDREYNDAEEKFWKKDSPTFIAGHTRHATVGAITRENAHPFNFSPIYGMHNGTIGGDWYDKVKYKTDSEAIFAMMKEKGLHKTLEHIHEYGTSPAYALVWFDKEDTSLNFLRNYQRPLHICTLSTNSTWYWASDAELLRWSMFQNKISGYTVKEIPVNTHFKFDLRANSLSFEEQDGLPEACKWKSYKGVVAFVKDEDKSNTSDYYTSTKNGPADYGSVDNPDYYCKFGKKEKDTYFTEWDVKSGRFLSKYQMDETRKWRSLATIKSELQKDLEKNGGSQTANQNFPLVTSTGASTQRTKTSHHSTTKSRFDKTQAKVRPVKDNVIPLFPEITNQSVNTELTNQFGPHRTKCTRADWYMKTKDGCVWCGNPVTEASDIFWGDDKSFLCDICSEKVTTKVSETNDILNFYPQAYNLLPEHTKH